MEDKEVTLTLKIKEVDQILVALSKRSLEEVIDVFNKIRAQSIEQVKPPEPPQE